MHAILSSGQSFGFVPSELFLSPSPGPRDWFTILYGKIFSQYRVASGELTP